MATYSKYKLYELYETDDGINWFPMGEYKAVLSEMYSRDCGYSARTIVEYDDECSGTTKVITATTKYQETYDSGATWITTSSTSSVAYEENSPDCGYSARTITETVDDCSGTTKVITTITKQQETYDSGNTWVTTSSTSSVTYEENSPDCGYSTRTIVEYDDECSGTTKVITATTKYQESYDSGNTWITTATSSSVTYEENSVDCGFEPKDYFTMVARTSGTFVFKGKSTNTIQYSTDYGNTWSSPSNNVTVNVNSGDNIMWKGEMTSSTQGIGRFSGGTASFDIQGNIMSLLFGDNFENQTSLNSKNYAFSMLFDDSNVINAQNLILPATTLAQYCYQYMFSDCTSLTTAPQLPATTLVPYCYNNMFVGCTSLTTAPELPATTLAQYCYANMFQGCTSLTTAPQLLATTLVKNCYRSMFLNCTSLTTAPVLSATKLVENCYSQMFQGCTNLNYIKMLATDISAQDCLFYWVAGVASSGTFVKSANAPSDLTSYIPINWTVQNV